MNRSTTIRKNREFKEYVVNRLPSVGSNMDRVHIKNNNLDDMVFIEMEQKNASGQWVPNPMWMKKYLIIGNTNGFYLFRIATLQKFINTHKHWVKDYPKQSTEKNTRGLVLRADVCKALCTAYVRSK